MMAVGLSPSEVKVHLDEFERKQSFTDQHRFTISCINSPSNVTLSARQKDIENLLLYLDERGVFARKLQVQLGYHSPQMRQISSEYIASLGCLDTGSMERTILMVSSVTGNLFTVDLATSPAYWNDNMVSQVNFAGAATRCFSQSPKANMSRKLDQSHLDEFSVAGVPEIGPHSTLKGPIRQVLEARELSNNVFYTSALHRRKPGDETFLNACGKLYCEHMPVDIELLTRWCRTSPSRPKLLTQLPKYPFDHSVIYWEENRLNSDLRLQKHGYNRFLGVRLAAGALSDTRWRIMLRTSE
jgi:acyl transferase domain-containing protein